MPTSTGPIFPRCSALMPSGRVGARPGRRYLPIAAADNVHVMSIGFFLQNEDHAVIWRGPMKHGVMKQFLGEVHWGALDYLIIDLPPGTGDEALSISHLIGKVDGAVIVTTPQDVALLDSKKSISFCKELKIPKIGVVENMSGMLCPHCGKTIDLFKTGGGERIAKKMKVPFLGRVRLTRPWFCAETRASLLSRLIPSRRPLLHLTALPMRGWKLLIINKT